MKFRADGCLGSILDVILDNKEESDRKQRLLSIEFLDTFAMIKRNFAIHDYHTGRISQDEFKVFITEAISALEDARKLAGLTEVGSKKRRMLDYRLEVAKQLLGNRG